VLRRGEVGDRDDLVRHTDDLDQVGYGALPRGVERRVDAVRRQLGDALGEALAVRGRRRAQRRDVVVVSLAGRADHRRAAIDGQLDRGAPDASGRAVDQHGGPRSDAEQVEHASRGLGRDRDRGGLGPGQAGRLDRDVVEDRVLRRRGLAEAEDLVADRHSLDVRPDLVDDPRTVNARDGGRLERSATGHEPGPDLPVDRVDARRPYGDADLARTGVRLRRLADDEDLRTAVLLELQGEHGVPLVVWTAVAFARSQPIEPLVYARERRPRLTKVYGS